MYFPIIFDVQYMPTFVHVGDSDSGGFSGSLSVMAGGPGLTEEEEAEVRSSHHRNLTLPISSPSITVCQYPLPSPISLLIISFFFLPPSFLVCLSQFAQENEQLFEHVSTMVDEVRQIEGKVIEISNLQELFSQKVLQQVYMYMYIHVHGSSFSLKSCCLGT